VFRDSKEIIFIVKAYIIVLSKCKIWPVHGSNENIKVAIYLALVPSFTNEKNIPDF
jgi:hypothetical protein